MVVLRVTLEGGDKCCALGEPTDTFFEAPSFCVVVVALPASCLAGRFLCLPSSPKVLFNDFADSKDAFIATDILGVRLDLPLSNVSLGGEEEVDAAAVTFDETVDDLATAELVSFAVVVLLVEIFVPVAVEGRAADAVGFDFTDFEFVVTSIVENSTIIVP